VRIWRICRKAFARNPLDGRGGLRAAGCWHTPRRMATYASESLALASLEVLVHCDLDLLPQDLMAIEIDVSPRVRIYELFIRDLPTNWRRYPVPPALQRLGNDWLDKAQSAVLRVPSALVPTECNLLLNPIHRDFRDIQVVRRFRFAFDERIAHRGEGAS
jgi:RES domain-containing protein